MDAIQFLKQEHEKAKAAFAKVLKATPDTRGHGILPVSFGLGGRLNRSARRSHSSAPEDEPYDGQPLHAVNGDRAGGGDP